jgi:hypothetical protein
MREYAPFEETDGGGKGCGDDERAERGQTEAGKEDVLSVKGSMEMVCPAVHVHSHGFA